jgi:hypothetical protein
MIANNNVLLVARKKERKKIKDFEVGVGEMCWHGALLWIVIKIELTPCALCRISCKDFPAFRRLELIRIANHLPWLKFQAPR